MKNKNTTEIMNMISIMFNGEKIYNPQGELKSVKVKTIWGELRYIVINQLERVVNTGGRYFSVDIYNYWELLQTRVFKMNSIEQIANDIGQYVIENT